MYTQVSYLPQNRNWTLQEVNDEQVKLLVPAIVFIIIAIFIGVTGNGIVIFVFGRRFKSSTYRCFILTLAVCDMISSSVALPFLVIDATLPYMFTNVLFCKCLRFVTYITSLVSICTLFLIAIERYFKICRPLCPQMSVNVAKKLLVLFAFPLGLAMAIPSYFMYGHSTVYTGVRNISGVQCFTDDSVVHTSFPTVYNFVLLGVVLIFGSAVVFCYLQISRQSFFTRRQQTNSDMHRNVINAEKKSRSYDSDANCVTIELIPTNTTNVSISTDGLELSINAVLEPTNATDQSNDANTANHSDLLTFVSTTTVGDGHNENSVTHSKPRRFVKRKATTSAKMSLWKQNRTICITKLLFIVTTVYAVSFLPHLILFLVVYIDDTFLPSLSPGMASIFHVVFRSFIINSVANPIVYGFLDLQFRKECCKLIPFLNRK